MKRQNTCGNVTLVTDIDKKMAIVFFGAPYIQHNEVTKRCVCRVISNPIYTAQKNLN